jgi:vesicle transport through interaction with t-SNAREs 1
MANPLDTDAGSELFSNYEAELNLVQADLNQKLDQIPELTGEERKSAIRGAERALDEAKELVCCLGSLELEPPQLGATVMLTLSTTFKLDQMNLEKSNIPSSLRSKVNSRYRNHTSDIDGLTRKLKSLSDDRKALFGDRYTDDPPNGHDAQLEQRQQLLSGTERLGRSSERLMESQRIALETEQIGAGTLADLHQQRNVIENTHRNLQQSEGYVDRSVKTLRGMARR